MWLAQTLSQEVRLMPRFYFDYYDRGIEATHDTEGTDLKDAIAALEEASAALGEMTKEVLRHAEPEHALQIRVRDQDDQPVGVCSVLFTANLVSPDN